MAGGVNGSNMTDPDRIWNEASVRLRAEIGDGPFSSYIAPSAVRVDSSGQLILVTPTAYARDWVRKNALRRMNELWLGLDGLNRRLDVRCRAEVGSAPPASAVIAGNVLDATPRLAAFASPTVPPIADGARAVRAAGLQDRLTFDSFVEGQGNAFALAIAKQVASWADGHFNPVFFCGPYGYGKTHLLNAIAWEAQRLRPEAKVVYLTAERFLSTFVKAMQDRSTAAFKESLRSADMLLLDDVQFVGGKTSTQEELLSTLTALIEDGKRIVFSADRAPMALTEVEPRLRSHLAAGLTCPVEAGDRELKIAVAQNRLKALSALGVVQGEAAPEVLAQLVDRTPGSMRELEGAVNTLAAAAGSRLATVSVDEASILLGAALRGGPERRITVDEIQKTVADHFNLKQADLLSERRTRSVARPRQMAMYLCKQHTTRSYPDIGRRFGGRDHTTVLHGVRKIEELMAQDDQIARDVEALTRKLRG
ncbi:MAG: chromosomal replication initiator protein DnaA [Alphaproteobacteria bacterium]|jgi:chromosomal replication initiator protein|nr:chromosomal replication initiator protein DnaA [Brevundimonas sp. BAL3]KDP93291.1 chromosomal replication initiation protein [Brevundimonas sp. EAKA]MBA4332142.1 chromosomal replication initiator protein DnaA [Brevundimonas sp.]MBU1270722.1 chromosomal replication initiator protein DnaA [Alphaproteobacteria bacterium]OGN47170.1 MAG: chromosomal replication initiation protein DnaA [Caulobacterales bacterium GWE1_67_11]OGN51065.1 MAG: chromosomal replication initiation protein DnaA [Caulobact